MTKLFRGILKLLGSLQFALFLIGALAVILIFSTLTESRFGTPFAQKVFYQAGWFDVFLALLGINILCSTLNRLPFKKKHTGFIVTHVGILLLLAGSLQTRLFGVEGQMLLYENEKSAMITQNQYEITVHDHAWGTLKSDLRTRFKGLNVDLGSMEKDLHLNVRQVEEHARKKWDVLEDKQSTVPNAAAKLKLESEALAFHETFWVIEHNALDPESSSKQVGPAQVLIERKKTPSPVEKIETKEPVLILTIPAIEQTFSISLANISKDTQNLGKSGWTIKNLSYFPDARVGEDNKMLSVSDAPNNPAVQFELLNPKGESENILFFGLFPDFSSMHGHKKEKADKPRLEIKVPGLSAATPLKKGPSLTLYPEKDKWSFFSSSSKTTTEGSVAVGQKTPAGWMDFHFTALELLSHAKTQEGIERLEGGGRIAAEIEVQKNGAVLWRGWLFEDEPREISSGSRNLTLSIQRKSLQLPFTLTLQDFRKVDYPGTRSAMSYESDVILNDFLEKVTLGKTIQMNQPLDYKGFRIFQSSFIDNSPQGEASVFTIAKNPGIFLIYTGSCVMFLGVILVFFIKPFSSFKYF